MKNSAKKMLLVVLCAGMMVTPMCAQENVSSDSGLFYQGCILGAKVATAATVACIAYISGAIALNTLKYNIKSEMEENEQRHKVTKFYEQYKAFDCSEAAVLQKIETYKKFNNLTDPVAAFEGFAAELESCTSRYCYINSWDYYFYTPWDYYFYTPYERTEEIRKSYHCFYQRYLLGMAYVNLLEAILSKKLDGQADDLLNNYDLILQKTNPVTGYCYNYNINRVCKLAPTVEVVRLLEQVVKNFDFKNWFSGVGDIKAPQLYAKIKQLELKVKEAIELLKATPQYESEKLACISSGKF